MNSQSRKINLLYFINSFDVGGAERAMARIVSRLDKEKYNITIVVLKMGSGQIIPEIENSGVEIINLEAKNKFDFSVPIKTYKLLKKKKIDILWCSLFYATFLGRIVGKLVKVPIIINWEHSERFNGLHRVILNKLTSSFSDVIIADSKKVAFQLENKLRISPQKIRVIPIGCLNLKDYSIVNNKKNRTKNIIGSVGSLRKPKGYSYLVKSAEIVIQKYPEIEFIIAGEGPAKEKLEQLILRTNLSRNFKLLG